MDTRKKKRHKPLDEREQRLVDLYFLTGGKNLLECYIGAGYSEKTAKSNSYRKFTDPRIVAEIRKRQVDHERKAIKTREDILARYEEIAWDPLAPRSSAIAALRELSIMTGARQPSAGDGRGKTLEDMREASDEDLARALAGGQLGAARARAEVVSLPLDGTDGRKK